MVNASNSTGFEPDAPFTDTSSSLSSLSSRWLRRLRNRVGHPPLALQLWDGQEIQLSQQPPLWRLSVRDSAALWRLVLDPDMQFGDLYASGRLEVEGNLVDLLTFVDGGSREVEHQCRRLRRPLLTSVIDHVRRAGHRLTGSSPLNLYHHYDIGTDFYQLWLDRQLVYTCAYFESPEMSLEEAQVAKLDHVCRKLRLSPGDRVVEAGCGWGALALHMARNYGVRVRAYNLSKEQLAYCRDRAREEGLAEQVEFIEGGWQDIAGEYDAFVSVGMLEHVGPRNYRRLGGVIDRCLVPSGRGLIHSIGRVQREPLNPWIERRIFPGAYPPSLQQMMDLFEPQDFAVLDVENLRLHYAETLRHWLTRFQAAEDQVRTMFDEKFVRMWRLYLAGSIAAFEAGGLQLYQVAFNRRQNNDVPPTRHYLYTDSVVGA